MKCAARRCQPAVPGPTPWPPFYRVGKVSANRLRGIADWRRRCAARRKKSGLLPRRFLPVKLTDRRRSFAVT